MKQPRYRLRLYAFTALILVGCATLLLRLYEFQIDRRVEFVEQVPTNFTIKVREPGIRGLITDRHGKVLIDNLRNYEVVFDLKAIRDDYRDYLLENDRKDEASELPLMSTIINEWVRPKLASHNLDGNYNARALNTHYITHAGLVPFVFRNDLSYDEFAYFAEHNLEFPGVSVRVSPRRHYPYGATASHVLGYTKQWEKGDISPADQREYQHYTGDSHGVAGIEASMDEYLQGAPGIKTLLKNEKGHILKLEDYQRPGLGAEVTLAIDSHIQQLVEKTLRRAGRAAAVVMDPNTGEVLAMASVPDYTPSHFIPSIDQDTFDLYRLNKSAPFANRAISGLTPGSTWKLPTALVAAQHDIAHTHENCPGYVQYGRVKIRCWKTWGHGSLGLEESIQRSCNVFFMNVANYLGTAKMVQGFEDLGLGKKTGIELPNEDTGILPGNRTWRRQIRRGASMTPALTGMLSIGQTDSSSTPLQVAQIISAIANGGRFYQPRIVKEVTNQAGEKIIADEPKLKYSLLAKGVSQEELKTIQDGMWAAVNKVGGTARRVSLKDIGIEAAAKTGTAQTSDLGETGHHVAWTASYAPFESPRYVVVVAVQRGSAGGAVAGPLVHLIYRGLFAMEEGYKLPLTEMAEYYGHYEVIPEIELPEEYNKAGIPVEGETGDEINELAFSPLPEAELPQVPSPTITIEADQEGSRPPRAITIDE